MPLSKAPDKFAKHLRTNRSTYQEYFGGFLLGGLYTIPNMTNNAVNKIIYDTNPSLSDTLASITGWATIWSYDKWLRPVGKFGEITGSISEGRFLMGQYAKNIGMKVAKKSPPVVAAAVGTAATVEIAESVITGTSNPITGTRSPKPYWIPLPLWAFLN